SFVDPKHRAARSRDSCFDRADVDFGQYNPGMIAAFGETRGHTGRPTSIRNGAVASAVPVHRGSCPLRLALAGATRSGSAGVGSLFATHQRLYALSRCRQINFRQVAITQSRARFGFDVRGREEIAARGSERQIRSTRITKYSDGSRRYDKVQDRTAFSLAGM